MQWIGAIHLSALEEIHQRHSIASHDRHHLQERMVHGALHSSTMGHDPLRRNWMESLKPIKVYRQNGTMGHGRRDRERISSPFYIVTAWRLGSIFSCDSRYWNEFEGNHSRRM